MKLTAFLLLIGCLQVSANGFAQGKITLRKVHASLEEVLLEINKQTGVLYSANNETLQKAKPIDINVKEEDLEKVLSICFNGQPLTYSMRDNIIIVKEKSGMVKVRIEGERNPIDVKGKVTDEKGNPVQGVTVTIKGTNKQTLTDENGEFSLASIDREAIIIFTSVNMETFEVKVNGQAELAVRLKTKVREMSEVVVSTGYQNIPKERATGSFVKVDNEQLNRSVSTDILSRLQGITSGLLFKSGIESQNPRYNQRGNIQLRSASTIFNRKDPLIILDNFPFEGDINSIDPNNIESITILKDAAAASIWGSKAGNGVIVLTTKSGKYNQPIKVSANSSIIIKEKPDLFYSPTLGSSDYIDVETFLFNKGYYNSSISSPFRVPLTPAVEVLLKRKNNQITPEDSAAQLNALKGIDVRNDLQKYYFDKPVQQQYNLTLSGGGANQQYFVSVGYNHNINTSSTNDRLNINAQNTYALLQNKLEIITGITYSNTKIYDFNSQYAFPYPYGQLADEEGNPLQLTRLRKGYIDTVGGGKLLDWHLFPLNERGLTKNKTNGNNYLLNAGIRYKIIKGLDVELRYQYYKQQTDQQVIYSQESYYARDLINLYSSINWTTGVVTRPIPLGAILDNTASTYKSQNARAQLNFTNNFNHIHQISGIIGGEISDGSTIGNGYRYYGYNEDVGLTVPVDLVNSYKTYISGTSQLIPGYQGLSGTYSRGVSIYGNAAYTYNSRYTLSASARRDGSNIFGTSTNNKWKPLWSVGFKWDLDKESFYHINWLPELKLRATYGYQGNVSSTVAGVLTTVTNSTLDRWRLPYSTILNYPNPDLRWEKIGQLNFALNYTLINTRFTGGIEYYRKGGKDIVGETELPPSSGVTSTIANTADIKGEGLDITFNTVNTTGKLKWTTGLLFSYARDWVSAYKIKQTTIQNYVSGGTNPIIGKPVSALYSYKWAGLDASGNPQGYINEQPSTNYTQLISSSNLEDMVYQGPTVAPFFGGLLNGFKWMDFSLSVNIVFKFGNYFRRPSIDYGSLVAGGPGHKDYTSRWLKAGDEEITNVPSFIYPSNSNRDIFYNNSEVLTEKGDNIRLQDIRFSYDLNTHTLRKLPFKNLQLYVYGSNLGVLWKANKAGIDPDYIPELRYTYGLPGKSFAAGMKIDF